MRFRMALIAVLGLGLLWAPAQAAQQGAGSLTLYYTGNTWGYLLPCPG